MPISQNLRFSANIPSDEKFDDSAAESLLRQLSAELAVAGWGTDEMDAWRGSGWWARCCRGAGELQIIVCPIPNREWMLQVAPRRTPGLVRGLCGAKPSATAAEVHDLALAIHRALS